MVIMKLAPAAMRTTSPLISSPFMPTMTAMRIGMPMTMHAVPMSGSSSMSAKSTKSSQYALPRRIVAFCSSFMRIVKYFTAKTMPTSFANSAGCRLNPPNEIQRRAPLTVTPATRTSTSSAATMRKNPSVAIGLCHRW